MPRRKFGIAGQPHFSFVVLGNSSIERLESRGRSSAERRHAAYWGGPMRHTRGVKKLMLDAANLQNTNTVDNVDHASQMHPPAPTQGKGPAKSGASNNRVDSTATDRFPDNIGSQGSRIVNDYHVYAAPHLTDCNPVALQNAIKVMLHVTGGFGEVFEVRLESLLKGKSLLFPTVYASLKVAQHMAITGKGVRADLLELKAIILRFVYIRISSKSQSPGLDVIATIAMLCTPILCLLTQEMPYDLSLQRYSEAASQGANICCSKSAATAATAATERRLHLRQLEILSSSLCLSKIELKHAESMQYLHRYVKISTLYEINGLCDDPPLHTGIADTTSTSAEPGLRCWMSPLAPYKLESREAVGVETPTDALVELMYQWVTTFLELPNVNADAIPHILRHRLELRHNLEQFVMGTQPIISPEAAIYACCWWAKSVMLRADQLHITLTLAASHIVMKPRLVACLRMTDLAGLWGPRKGLLYWIVSLCHIVTRNRCFPLLTTALYAHFASEMAAEVSCFRIGVSQLTRLHAFERSCRLKTMA